MHFSTLQALAVLALTSVARGHETKRSHRSRAHSINAINARATKNFTLSVKYQGQNFLDNWDFFTDADPTHGLVQYQSKADAQSKGLAFIQPDGTTVLAVDDTNDLPVGKPRNSVRITSKKKFNGGLFIADFNSMPHGCATWPAYWSVGPNWPNAGEIDVLEGVNEQSTNQYTLHTRNGCNLDSNNNNGNRAKFTANVINTKCESSGADNSGCAFIDTDTRSYGHGFNTIGGGVYAHLWDSAGISIWHFPRDEIPADITTGAPNPSSWPTPNAFFAASKCDIDSHFFDHQLVIDTTLCGDFAGAVFSKQGCPSTCEDFVSKGSNFKLAKWNINYISVFN